MSAVLTEVPVTTRLEGYVADYIAAKRDEEAAKARRLAAETLILTLAPAREEGSKTTEVGDYKLTTTGKLTYKLSDIEALRHITARWDAHMVPLKTVHALDETGCKYLRQHHPELWAQLAQVITIVPAKTAIKVGI